MNVHINILFYSIILLNGLVYAKKDLSKWEFEWGFSGISTFAHLPVVKCLADPSQKFDIGILGLPLDTAVSFRPGARFGPRAIRHASARQTSFRGFNARAGINPYQSWAKVLDCADVPVTPFDNVLAVEQIEEAYTELLSRPSLSDPKIPPKIVSLGGDHTIALPTLRALYKKFDRPISVLHFDAHLDTWAGDKYPCPWESETTEITHGTMFWIAGREGLISNSSSAHAGLRTRLSGTDYSDYDDDSQQGFMRISTDDIDTIGTEGIIKAILDRMGGPDKPPVYLSFDIDVIDPSIAPGTGTPEVGGWTTREVIRILRGIESLNIVAADIVEVSPSYDHAEITALAGAQVVYEIITSIVKNKLESTSQIPPEHSNRLRVEL